MSTAIKIAIAVIIVALVLRWLLSRAKPRMQHYFFGHGLLPKLVLSQPDEVLSTLLSPTGHSPEGESFLINLWLEAGKDLPDSQHIPTAGLTYSMDVLHSPRSAVYIIQFPKPERPLECYFAAIVFDSVAFAVGQPAGVRYLTLERSIGGTAMIGESRFSGENEIEHIEHECDGSDRESFLAALRKLVTDHTQLDDSAESAARAN